MISKGQVLNGVYEIKQPIGEGGAGEVYLAYHKNLQKDIVVKRIKDKFVNKMNIRLEADILKKIKHRYITQVYDFIQIDNDVYTIMDYVDGNALVDYLKAGIRFDEWQIVTWMKELADALSYIHSQDIIHNDIKPANIMIDRAGHVCLIDFNVSADDAGEGISGGFTRSYASPEQTYRAELQTSGKDFRKVKLDARSDIFSLGATMYHMMTLENPLNAMDGSRHPFDSPQPYSELLMAIIDKCIQRDPKDRYQSAGELLKDLESMKIRDKAYKNLKLSRSLFNGLCVISLALGAFLCVQGLSLKNEEVFYGRYQVAVKNSVINYDYDDTITECLELLNDGKYEGIYKKSPELRANLLYIVANCYFENEDYDNAVAFYKRTVEASKSNPDYYRDYAIALARNGKVDGAKSVLEESKRVGLKDADLYLVEAEIALKENNNDLAIEKFDMVLATADSDNTIGRSYMLKARAYRQSGMLKEAVDTLDSAVDSVNEAWRIRLYRELGSTCIFYMQENGRDRSGEYISLAKNCYEVLTNSDRANKNDYLNLESFHEMLGEYDQAEAVLDRMEGLYPDYYGVFMRRFFLQLYYQSQKTNESRDYGLAKEYYNKAVSLYEIEKNAGASDERMAQMEDAMAELLSKGW